VAFLWKSEKAPNLFFSLPFLAVRAHGGTHCRRLARWWLIARDLRQIYHQGGGEPIDARAFENGQVLESTQEDFSQDFSPTARLVSQQFFATNQSRTRLGVLRSRKGP
jgi:hypothetical protein